MTLDTHWRRRYADGEAVLLKRYEGPGVPRKVVPVTILRLDVSARWRGQERAPAIYYVADPERGEYPAAEDDMARDPGNDRKNPRKSRE